MSGKKDVTVTISSSERDRLVNSARAAAESVQQSQRREQQAQNALNVANTKLDALNRTLNNEISGLHSDMRSLANEQNRRLREQAAAVERQIKEQTAAQDRKLQNQTDAFNRSIGDVKRQMESQRVALQTSINEVRQRSEENRRELQSSIEEINARINAKEQNHRNIANFWIEQTQAYFNDIAQYRHDMFTPGQLAKLRSRLDLMRSDLQTGAFQAAIASARAVFNDAVDLKEEVVNAETEWNYYHSLFQQALAGTKSNLSYYQSMQFTFAAEDGEETVDAQINYWTDNALIGVGEALSKIEQQERQIDKVPKDGLIELTDSLAQLNSQMELAASRAKEALISSQIRSEMANTLIQALTERGWECDGVTYECNEQTEPVHVKLSDGMGNEIVAVITPDKDSDDMTNQLEINFFDPQSNDEEMRQTCISSINNGLKESGVNVGTPVCREGFEVKPSDNITLRDIEATARRKMSSKR